MSRSQGRLIALLLAVITVVSLGLGSAGTASAKPRTASPTTVPITGTVTGTGDAITGTFDVTRFANQGGTLMAIGTFTGTSGITGTAPLALPVNLDQSSGSCEILDLVLGPLDLNLLGLEVHLDQVHLNITAQQGPGNLLGNLLCAVAGLLDSNTGVNAILTQIAALLNQILGAL
jgi:hypothetical protein